MSMRTGYGVGTILAGASVSNNIACLYDRLAGLTLPSAWTTAALTFLVSSDGVNFYSVFGDDGLGTNTEISIASATMTARLGDAIVFTDAAALAINAAVAVQLRSGTDATAVNQTATRTFSLIMVPR